MKKMLWILALAIGSGNALFAQSFPGTWQGALKVPQAPNGELRIVLKISTTTADKLAADFYSIDQRTPAIPATSVAKTKGATIDRISRRNTFAAGPSCFATSGNTTPKTTPSAMPMKIHEVTESRFIVSPSSTSAEACRRTSCAAGG